MPRATLIGAAGERQQESESLTETISAKKRVAFLFNHDAAHQAAHGAGIMGELAKCDDAISVFAACGSPAIERAVRDLVPATLHGRICWVDLALPTLLDRIIAPINQIAPVRRMLRLDRARDFISSLDLLVSTERTCLRVKRKLGNRAPPFVFVPHGAGDRTVTYHPELAQFDLFLLSGQKVIDQMIHHGIARREQCRLIGYPKFDTIEMDVVPRFFDNDNPVFLYNPHFDPYLSSWYDLGRDVLAFFAAHADRYNLIFAPHVMLFRKKLHYSLEYRTARIRPDIPQAYRDAPNILIDVDSPRLMDMSYTRAANAYIGDVSSQVYEFLVRPRACFYLDVETGTTTPYEFWQTGDVFRSVEGLAAAIPQWREAAARYKTQQTRLFRYTIDDDKDASSSVRGALALADYVLATAS